jgi:hypothetical protein
MPIRLLFPFSFFLPTVFKFDEDGSGSIDAEELKAALHYMGLKVGDDDATVVMELLSLLFLLLMLVAVGVLAVVVDVVGAARASSVAAAAAAAAAANGYMPTPLRRIKEMGVLWLSVFWVALV